MQENNRKYLYDSDFSSYLCRRNRAIDIAGTGFNNAFTKTGQSSVFNFFELLGDSFEPFPWGPTLTDRTKLAVIGEARSPWHNRRNTFMGGAKAVPGFKLKLRFTPIVVSAVMLELNPGRLYGLIVRVSPLAKLLKSDIQPSQAICSSSFAGNYIIS